MVVCNTPLMPLAPASCPMTPTLHAFTQGLCPLSPISAIPCNQRYPPTAILSTGPMLTASTSVPRAPGLSTSPVIRCNPAPATSQSTPNSSDSLENSVSNVITCNVVASNNGVFTSNLVPCTTANIVPLTNGISTIVPYNQGLASAAILQCNPKVQCNQGVSTSTVSTPVQCNQGIYTCNTSLPTGAVVPCTQRVISGTSVLQCTPGVCQLAPAAVFPTAPLEMCLPSTPILQNNPGIYPVTPPLSITQNLCTATAASTWKQSYGMEQVWQCEFRNLFSQYAPHVWILLPVVQKPVGDWNGNVDSAKVRFCCEDCGHGWTSMKGRVAFWFCFNHVTLEGIVCLKLYGQQCDRCKTGNYEPAMWYPEEVVKVLVNIYNRVGQVYYGFHQAPYHRARRPGKPRTPHNSDLCQACKDGVCAERR